MMNPIFSKRSRYLYIPAIFLTVFSLISLIYIRQDAELDRKHFKTHALIIADDTWALNLDGAKAYLQLAVQADHYQELTISIPGDDEFLRISDAPLTGITLALHKVGLIGLKELSENIFHKNETIGSLNARQYIMVIFPLLNILVVLLFVLLTTIFIIYLNTHRNFLEREVLERTRNLQESERRFHDLVDLLPEMVLETDLKGQIEYYNKAAKERLKIPLAPTIPATFSQFITNEDKERAIQHFHASLLHDSTGLQEFIATDPENRTFPILLRSAPIHKGDKIIGVRMIVIDMTDRHRLEEQLLRDQKMKAIGLMAGGVAHDLNNILSGIISYPELLLLDMGENDRMRRPLEAIRRAGLDAAEVVADLLTVARGIAATREVTNLNILIEDYLASPDFHQLRLCYPLIVINTSLDEDLLNIYCSPIHIRKCLMNLITNGMEAIQGKGTLFISTRNYHQVEQMPHTGRELPKGLYAKIAIYDSGSGISPHEIEHIFEPFYTKKVMGRSGTGLGLAVVWNTLKDHGGIVNVTSDFQGTTFELYLPSVEEKAPAVSETSDWRSFKGNGEHVLVIDDEPRQRMIAGELLKSLNYQVETVSSGEEAVTYLATHSADLLVLDMIMNPGQNGRVTYEKILKIQPQQKALIASGFAEDDDVRATLALGAAAFVGKPYTLEKIGAAIYKILYT
ncbi:MAG: response regulator [Proteobacteria bacterium]|nr:response regulator [Pseudomonadota bacterium]